MLAKVTAESLNFRSSPEIANNIIGSFDKGQVVELIEETSDGRWAKIKHLDREGYASRRYLAQAVLDAPVLDIDPAIHKVVSDVIWNATERYDGITYRLGCKAKADGTGRLVFSGTDTKGKKCTGATVDCSGWVQGLAQLIAANVNQAHGSTVFTGRAIGPLFNHSDAQIVYTGKPPRRVVTGTDIDRMVLRSGLIFGINFGDYSWEGRGRVYGIDHIVIGVMSPDNVYYISQSSSGGQGVNKVAWKNWRQSTDSLFERGRVFCADLMALGDYTRTRSLGDTDAEYGEDPYNAAAG
jgi:hypothetical protein